MSQFVVRSCLELIIYSRYFYVDKVDVLLFIFFGEFNVRMTSVKELKNAFALSWLVNNKRLSSI